MPRGSLADVCVLVCRPGEQGEQLVELINSSGGDTCYPKLMEIELLPETTEVQRALADLDGGNVSMLVFVSVHAVRSFVTAMQTDSQQLPKQTRIAAIGAKTAEKLEQAGFTVDLVPDTEMNSENLLALFEQTDLSTARIQIYRGQSGRTLLADTLRRNGATVAEVQCYQRQFFHHGHQAMLENFLSRSDRVITVTSVALLETLLASFDPGSNASLFDTPLVALSGRIAEAAGAAGFTRVGVAKTTDNHGLVDAVVTLIEAK